MRDFEDYLENETLRYAVKNWPKVAVYVDSYPQKYVPFEFYDEDEDGNEILLESDEGEWIDDLDSNMVNVVMVGDDRKHLVDIDDLIPLDDLDYCTECGQIGCSHDGRTR